MAVKDIPGGLFSQYTANFGFKMDGCQEVTNKPMLNLDEIELGSSSSYQECYDAAKAITVTVKCFDEDPDEPGEYRYAEITVNNVNGVNNDDDYFIIVKGGNDEGSNGEAHYGGVYPDDDDADTKFYTCADNAVDNGCTGKYGSANDFEKDGLPPRLLLTLLETPENCFLFSYLAHYVLLAL